MTQESNLTQKLYGMIKKQETLVLNFRTILLLNQLTLIILYKVYLESYKPNHTKNLLVLYMIDKNNKNNKKI